MRKPPTGEPCAGKPPARFGGRGGREPFPTPMLYERAPTPHWKWGTVDWKELQMTWTTEEPTRLAQLFAGETHLTELNKDLVEDAVRKGYKLIRSRDTAQQTLLAFGGLYFGTEDK